MTTHILLFCFSIRVKLYKITLHFTALSFEEEELGIYLDCFMFYYC